jgi:hypothetical protein
MKKKRTWMAGALVVALAGAAACSDDGGSAQGDTAAAPDTTGDAAGDTATPDGTGADSGAGDATGDSGAADAAGDASTQDGGTEDASLTDTGKSDAISDDVATGDTTDPDTSTEDAGDAGGDTGDAGDATDPGETALLGTLTVLEQAFAFEALPYGYVTGAFYDAEPTSFLTPVAEESGCVVSKHEAGFCDPPCGWGQSCTNEGVCQDWPVAVSVGDITVTGLKSGTLELKGGKDWAGYASAEQLPTDLFDESSVVTATATGDALAAFTMTANGVADMSAALKSGVLELSDETGATLDWAPGDPSDTVRITLNANNDCHGCPYEATLVCDVPDTGQFTIPASLVKLMPAMFPADFCAGSDCPPSWIDRVGKGTAQVEGGHVELRLTSRYVFKVQH